MDDTGEHRRMTQTLGATTNTSGLPSLPLSHIDDALFLRLGRLRGPAGGAVVYASVRRAVRHLYNIQCSEIFTLRNEKLHTEA
jgi:hypothetical protein